MAVPVTELYQKSGASIYESVSDLYQRGNALLSNIWQ